MKLPSLCLALLFTASAVWAADADSAAAPAASAAVSSGKPTLHGLIASGDNVRFLLTTPGEGSGKWYSIGDSAGDWKLASYRDKDGVLVLHRADGAGADVELSLVHAHADAVDNQATLEQAKAMLQKMNFGAMMNKVMDQQKQAMMALMRQGLAKQGLSGAAMDAAIAKQTKAMDAIYGALDFNSMEGDIAKVYSDVFTSDELNAISDFYSTPAGQSMLAKQPQVQKETMQVIMPKLMQAMQSAQRAARAQAQAEAQQAQSSGAAPVSPAPQP